MSSNDDDLTVSTDAPEQDTADGVASQPEPDGQPATAPRPRGGRLLGGLALAVALAALGASGWLAFRALDEAPEQDPVLDERLQTISSMEQSIDSLAERLSAVERRQQSDGDRLDRIETRIDSRDAQLAPLEQALGRVEERTGALLGQVGALEQALTDRTAENADLRRRLESAIEQLDARGDLQREIDRDLRQQMLMLEASGLLRVGQDLAELHGRSREAQRAFERARQRLESIDDARLDQVRRSLAREIEALAAHQAPALDAELARLQRLGRESRAWPVQLPEAEPDPGASAENEGWRDRLGRTFGALVQVESRDSLGRDEEQFQAAREQLQLRLLAAELALMRRDAVALGAQAQAAIGLLDEWFDPGAGQVRAAREELQRLAALDLNPELPALGATLEMLQSRLDGS